MWKHLLKFLRLSRSERRCLLMAALLASVIRCSLSLLPFKSVLRLSRRLGSPGSITHSLCRPASVHQIVWAVKAACRYVPDASCLTRSLVLQILLAQNGRKPSLNIGVAKSEDGTLKAHAWTEEPDELLLNDGAPRQFTKLVSFGGENS